MSKRNYTHSQTLLPEIKVMVAAGKSQREVADHFGFRDKCAVNYSNESAKKGGHPQWVTASFG